MNKLFKSLLGQNGITLDDYYWEVNPPKSIQGFFSKLPLVFPDDTILYFEGVYEEEVMRYLKSHLAEQICTVARGTIIPRLNLFHVPMAVNLKELDDLIQRIKWAYVVTHFHAYRKTKMLLYWHDACELQMPFYLPREIPEEKLNNFCKALNTTFERAPEFKS